MIEINSKIIEASQNLFRVVIKCANSKTYTLEHDQDCCEQVWLEDSDGNIADYIGKTLHSIEEVSNDCETRLEGSDDEFTWTFYKINAGSESITYRFYGTSNGWYSEDVSLYVTGGE